MQAQRGFWLARLPGARSLHRQLLTWLLLPQVVLWLAAAFFTYNLAARYANEAIDASLSQASRALARQVRPTASGLFIDFPRSAQDILESDPTDRVFYAISAPPGRFILGTPNLLALPPIKAPEVGEPQFYDDVISEPGASDRPASQEAVRVVALYLPYGLDGAHSGTMLVQVARSRANREKLARQILVDTALPLSALMLLMTAIVWTGIRAGLKPLTLLRGKVEGRAANDLAPIEVSAAPPEVRSLAQAMNTLLAEVNHNVVAQKRFISDAAHQLRTPLAGLKSQTELALGETSDPALQARLRRVHQSATRSAHLVNQLLSLARAEPESASLQGKEPVDMRRLAQEVSAELVPRALQAGIDLGFDEGDSDGEPSQSLSRTASQTPTRTRLKPPALVRGTELLLREALINLVDNAIRYAGSGASVTVRVRPRAKVLDIEVEDNGPGVALAEREHVFARFVRATSEGDGCGLGLAIVREIVQRHAGQVQLHGVIPQGCLARVTLPLAV